MKIEVSQHSQNLIKKYLLASGVSSYEMPSISIIDLNTLIDLLTVEQTKKINQPKRLQQKNEYILASLQASLLSDLLLLERRDHVVVPGANKNSSKDKIKFILLTLAGILVAACQGFDGIVTMLSIFSLPSLIILGAGFAFSLISVIVFCGFDLVKVSNALGVKLSEAYKLLDTYLLQLQLIKELRETLDGYDLSVLSATALKEQMQIVSLLKERFKSITKASEQFEKALHSEKIKTVKRFISGISAFLFFGGGFFSGQSVALFLASLIVNSLIPAFWPVTLFSILVGLAAFSLYWFVERPSLDKLVSSWFGLNEENVEKLCDEASIKKEAEKLERLEHKIKLVSELTNKVSYLEHMIYEEQMDHSPMLTEKSVEVKDEIMTHSLFTFFKVQQPLSTSLVSSIDDEYTDESVCCFI
ncbi:coiled-coil protein [Legionella wadsworthii]|uniref:Coiled-coil protein n=1 Tax=Legionella wadsworthii TaxID=28088 RepID=A0A378LN02_9GAMM|nr:hypothetical protein [Legionella wadsworthii]STY28037.1 coiled-coil protein [Legionella wadsworthii]